MLIETTRVEKSDRERVTERERSGRARSRGEVEGAGFLGNPRVQMHVRFLGERGVGVAGQGDELGTLTLDQGNDREQLVRLARIREREHHVLSRDHPQIAVAGFCSVEEKSRCSGAGHRGGDLAGDVSRLADAAYDDAAAARQDQSDCVEKALVEPRDQRAHRIGLDGEHLSGELEGRSRNRFFRSIVHSGKRLWPAPLAPFMIGEGVYQTDSAIPAREPPKTRTSRWAARLSWS